MDGWEYVLPALEEYDDPGMNYVEDRSVVYEVELVWFSPADEGEEREPYREPDEHSMIELKPTDPRPYWPEEDNEWRKQIMQEHGDWTDEIPTGPAEETKPI